jgi:hypothetical protein
MFHRCLRLALLSASVAAALAFVWLVGARALQLPLDDGERRLLSDASRIAAGQPLEAGSRPEGGPSSVEVPLAGASASPAAPAPPRTSMPGLALITSVPVLLFGAADWMVRVGGLLALVAAAAIAVHLVRIETGSGTLAAVALGLFLAGQLLAPDQLGRGSAEAVMVALAVGGYAVLRLARGILGAIAAAALLVAATLVHPFALLWIVAALVHLALEDWRRAIVFALAAVALGWGSALLLSERIGPWWRTAALLPAFAFHPARALRLIGDQLLGRYSVLTLVVVLSAALPVRPWRGAGGIWMWMTFATIGGALLATQTSTPDALALLPLALALAIVGPIAMQRVAKHLSAWPGSTRLAGQGVVLVALALQFTALISRLPAALSHLR